MVTLHMELEDKRVILRFQPFAFDVRLNMTPDQAAELLDSLFSALSAFGIDATGSYVLEAAEVAHV